MQRAKGNGWDGSQDNTNDVFADIANNTFATYTASGAIAERNAVVHLDAVGALAMSLLAPIAGDVSQGGEDGKNLVIISDTAAAHVVTSPVDGFNGAGTSGTATFGGVGAMISLKAANGHWYVQSAMNIAEFASNASQAWLTGQLTTLLTASDPVTISISTLTISAVNTAFGTVQTQLETILNALR